MAQTQRTSWASLALCPHSKPKTPSAAKIFKAAGGLGRSKADPAVAGINRPIDPCRASLAARYSHAFATSLFDSAEGAPDRGHAHGPLCASDLAGLDHPAVRGCPGADRG